MGIALDYTTRIAASALQAAGVTTVCRYLSWPHYWAGKTHTETNPKIIQQAEYDELAAAGIRIILNWEYDSHDWMGGASSGTVHAAEAVRQAQALGYPAGGVIVGSADFDMSKSEWDTAGHAYAVAWATVIEQAGYTPGVYGPYDVLSWCRNTTGISFFWQAGMSTSWSQRRNASAWPGAHLRQLGTKTVGGVPGDWNDILKEVDVAGEADAAFSKRYTGSEPWIRGDSWMALAVEARLTELLARPAVAPVQLTAEDREAIITELKAELPTAADIARALITELTG
jgi:hypothetical protein